MSRVRRPSEPSRRDFYLRLVRASAWYDLVVTAGFATPWTYALVHGVLTSLGEALGVGGLPQADPMQVLYANLLGSVVVVWALLRIVRPLPVHGLFDGAARALFALWQAYALTQGATGVLWFFLVVEASACVAQLLPWWRGRAADATGAPVLPPRAARG
ncbi:hypothetical protein [Streptomyces sp. JJ38]|uniref:hypothetical protein n=1 Tax=Streptomyces sp. JJ38 TaxID=2738128 RepID=UPI001C5779F6|nr:hypothetical protein [Streptomyces sp. JJ38]MBW1600227.1 hypothetical protein [Streptomyces sp. JJ38]